MTELWRKGYHCGGIVAFMDRLWRIVGRKVFACAELAENVQIVIQIVTRLSNPGSWMTILVAAQVSEHAGVTDAGRADCQNCHESDPI